MSDKLRSLKDKEDVLFDLAKLENMASEPRDLKDEPGTALCDYLYLVFGAVLIGFGLFATIVAFMKKSWGLCVFCALVLLICSMVGGKLVEEAWENLKRRRPQG